MDFIKNDLIDDINERTYESHYKTLDTADFVEDKYNKQIRKRINKEMKSNYKKIDVYYLLILEDKGLKLSLFQKLKIAFSGLRNIYNIEKNELDTSSIINQKKQQVKEKEKTKKQDTKKKP